jgi:NADH-quinone oxidoreductase subunit F
VVGLGSCGIASGGRKVFGAIEEEIRNRGLKVQLGKTGCIGMCYREVLVEIEAPNLGKVSYGNVTPDMVPRLIKEHLIEKRPVYEWIALSEGLQTPDTPFLSRQKRITLRNCGRIDPESIEDFLSAGGYKAIEKAVKTMRPEEVIDIVDRSRLRGRGGAGFPTGLKWRLARQAVGDEKFIICNGDEGDPGAFVDRVIMESDPHSLLEGMLIAGYAMGADRGFIYVREEYPLAIKRLRVAIEQAEAKGFLKRGLFSSDFKFSVDIKKGAGAFVCGEETGMIASIEGRRGMPRLRPPFPTTSGLFGKPTCINNVKTLTTIPWIIINGAEAFNVIGTEKSKGTAVFSLTGKVVRGGLVEVPMGTTLREIIFDYGGGIRDGHKAKAVQIGGPSGGCIPEPLMDTPVDYESLTETGAIMGSGGMVVMDETTCMVDIAKFFLNFTQNESCGKCTFCRVGTKRMLEILTGITEGRGQKGDLEALESLARMVKVGALCGLGQTAPNPVLTTLKYFREEYESHIKGRICPTHRCKNLVTYWIKIDSCRLCGECAKLCPVGAISLFCKKDGEPWTYLISGKCTKCGACVKACRFNAVGVR